MLAGHASRPTVREVWGQRGAIATGHPLATAAAQEIFALGGNAVDAAVAAQAALAVVAPHACGPGGDAVALVTCPGREVTAAIGAGAFPAMAQPGVVGDDASAVTVPGALAAWDTLLAQFGALPRAEVIEPAARLAENGVRVGGALLAAAAAQRSRLARGGAGGWPLLRCTGDAARLCQPELSALLRSFGQEGSAAFYRGRMAGAIAQAARRDGGTLDEADLAAHRTRMGAPVTVPWRGGTLALAPPPSQAILLAMALRAASQFLATSPAQAEHISVESVKAAFDFRDQVGTHPDLLGITLHVDPERARPGSRARAYLHTAAVATADSAGTVVSSLVSLFDDFGAATFVPEGGFVLNNRGSGFTIAPNDARPAKWPVHTLSPAIMSGSDGETLALATPGADGQVQTLLQVLRRAGDAGWASAIAEPRWRSEGSWLFAEREYPHTAALGALGHAVSTLPDGDDRFGSVVAAGLHEGFPFAAADWRRQSWAGVA
jgi:gamma-glutamyltranspeptidase/glutathione hydrolase